MLYSYGESLLDPKNCATKRVSRACDRCRLKKTKCDGRRCCNRCLADDAICVFSKRKRSSDRPYSSEYVQLLEDQQMKLIEGVQDLYRKLRRGEGWTGPAIAEDSQGYPLVQDVLDALAVLAPCERRNLKAKSDDASTEDQDDDEDASSPFEDATQTDSATPPLAMSEDSQSSRNSPPIEDNMVNQFDATYVANLYQQQCQKSISTVPEICLSDSVMPPPPLAANDSQYWPPPSSFSGPAAVPDYVGYMDPFPVGHMSCDWYQDAYTMI